jgi:hypothetical protein
MLFLPTPCLVWNRLTMEVVEYRASHNFLHALHPGAPPFIELWRRGRDTQGQDEYLHRFRGEVKCFGFCSTHLNPSLSLDIAVPSAAG